MVVIIDYGMGNLRSVEKALRRIDVDVIISSNNTEILEASKIILPGVGHFENGMKNLKEKGFIKTLNKAVLENRTPILGICLGMQLLTNKSDEGEMIGLGFLDVNTVKFNPSLQIKIPHMGWNSVKFISDPLFDQIKHDDEFYFAHSFHIDEDTPKPNVLGYTHYGCQFPTALKRNHILGVQFHPEKSFYPGLQLLSNFVKNY